MPSPQYLDALPRKLTGIYTDLENAIIKDIARRIVKANYLTPTAQWQIEKAKQLRLSNGEIAKLIAQNSSKSRKEIAQMFRVASFDTVEESAQIYRQAGLNPTQFFRSSEFDSVVRAGIKNTGGLLENFTKTTAKTADKAFERLLDRAYFEQLSGAFSYQQVIKKAVAELADKGIQEIAYPKGHVDKADVAVRRAVLTSVNQTSMQLTLAYAEEMGCDLVETTAHAGARPDHANWQGKVFSLSGKSSKYPNFRLATGYGTGAGLGGWNCRHSFHPYFEGQRNAASTAAYSKEYLAELDKKRYSYNDKDYSEYEVSQIKRRFERKIRDIKRQLTVYDGAISGAEDKAVKLEFETEFARKSTKLKEIESKMRGFLQQVNQPEDSFRTQTVGFGKSISQKAAWANRKMKLPNFENAVIAKEKTKGYALNKNHNDGKHKALVFEKVLGYTENDADILEKQVRANLKKYAATMRPKTQHGQPYEVRMVIEGLNGRKAVVKTGWLIDNGKTNPRLTSIYVD